jgi:hypothetical protein
LFAQGDDYLNPCSTSPSDIQRAVLESFTPSERQELMEMQSTPNLYSKMVNSLAPTIFGKIIVVCRQFTNICRKRGNQESCVVAASWRSSQSYTRRY